MYIFGACRKKPEKNPSLLFSAGGLKNGLRKPPFGSAVFVEWIAKTGHFLGYKISWKTTRLRVAKLSVWAGDVLQHLLGFRLHRKHHVFWIKVRGSTCWVEWARFWCGKDGGARVGYSIYNWLVVSNVSYFHPEPWGNDPIRLICFKWVETTKHGNFFDKMHLFDHSFISNFAVFA